MKLQTRQDELLASAEQQQFVQAKNRLGLFFLLQTNHQCMNSCCLSHVTTGLDDHELCFYNIKMRVATHQQPQSVVEAKAQLDLHKEWEEEILACIGEYSD
ncbi:Spectrin beta chain [Schistosoma japonicum]|nr:Spectrin beta chain [Schistosoma japonicum]